MPALTFPADPRVETVNLSVTFHFSYILYQVAPFVCSERAELAKQIKINTYHRSVDEVLRLTAFLLPIDNVEVDFGWVANGLVSIRWDLNKQHVLNGDRNTCTEKHFRKKF